MPEQALQGRSARILLVGVDASQRLAQQLHAAGYVVVTANGNDEALEHARRERFDTAVLVSKGSLITVTEILFNLRDVSRSMEIIVLVDARHSWKDRFLRQLIDHPISGTSIMTRRELWKRLQDTGPPTAWAVPLSPQADSMRRKKKA
jgi:hypothetical protein